MLVTAKEVLSEARRRQYAVPAFDCVEDVMVRTMLETAESLRAPVFLMCLLPDLEGNGWAYLPGLIKAAAAHHSIPVVLHLDHATELGTVRQAVEAGFTSVMIDGSQLPFEDNVRLTKAAVYKEPKIVAEVSRGLGEPMRGLDAAHVPEAERLQTRGW